MGSVLFIYFLIYFLRCFAKTTVIYALRQARWKEEV